MNKFGAGRGSDTEGAGARMSRPTSSAATESAVSLGREGMVTVWDSEGHYVGCMGVELWRHLLTVSVESVRDA